MAPPNWTLLHAVGTFHNEADTMVPPEWRVYNRARQMVTTDSEPTRSRGVAAAWLYDSTDFDTLDAVEALYTGTLTINTWVTSNPDMRNTVLGVFNAVNIELDLLLVDHVRKFLNAGLIARITTLRAAILPTFEAVRTKVASARLACHAIVTKPQFKFLLEFDDLNDQVIDLYNERYNVTPFYKSDCVYELTYTDDVSGTIFDVSEQETRLTLGYVDNVPMGDGEGDDGNLHAIQQAFDTGTHEALIALGSGTDDVVSLVDIDDMMKTLTTQLTNMTCKLRSVGTDAASVCIERVAQYSARVVALRNAIHPKLMEIQEAVTATAAAATATATAAATATRAVKKTRFA